MPLEREMERNSSIFKFQNFMDFSFFAAFQLRRKVENAKFGTTFIPQFSITDRKSFSF